MEGDDVVPLFVGHLLKDAGISIFLRGGRGSCPAFPNLPPCSGDRDGIVGALPCGLRRPRYICKM